eukprot:TRINITY_DN663_c0_g1_i13.p2 TRINITY_DN663_c0_g1~~TRINITY_DN663_c0_g1_i13.p2  ORF type:complete len:282 (-),score=81.14 TRINITY_DN663_c0_g1_i13:960-1805(-)
MLRRLAEVMDRIEGRKSVVFRGKEFSGVNPKSRYRIPYLSYKHPACGLAINIFINHLSPSFSATLISYYFQLDPRIKTICQFVLHWAGTKNLLRPSRGYFSSYALVLMVIFFLQIQSTPVVRSLQLHADENAETIDGAQVPSFQKLLKRRPRWTENMKYHPESLKYDFLNLNFMKVDVEKAKEKLCYPRNEETAGELLTKFILEKNTRKMSIRYAKYMSMDAQNEKMFAYCIEDPLNVTLNPGHTVLLKSAEYPRIVSEFKKAYLALLNKNLSWFTIQRKC